MTNAPTHLRVEHLDDGSIVDVPAPRLSWHLPAGAKTQIAYHIRADSWDSGRVESDQSVLVPYEGPALESRQVVRWAVKVWTDEGDSGWSEEGSWRMGLLEPGDWKASWISPGPEKQDQGTHLRPAVVMRREFTIDRLPVEASLYTTAHGVYEAFLNGVRVGDHELTPGATSYSKHLLVQHQEVRHLLRQGLNSIDVLVSDGWFRGQSGVTRQRDLYGTRLAVLAQLELLDNSGVRSYLCSDENWLCGYGPVVGADLMQGQHSDLTVNPGHWSGIETVSSDLRRLRVSPAPPVRQVQEVTPLSVTRLGPGRTVVDLGQNINGWVRLNRLPEHGTHLTLKHGEILDNDGQVTLENVDLSRHESDLGENLKRMFPAMIWPLQVDEVIASGNARETFEPRHTVHGFRYVQVDGEHPTLMPEDVTGVVVHTDLRRTGWFECSDERLNKLHDTVMWSLRGNACDIPTDCPQRERAGWTGDWQIFVATAALMFDVAGFSTKWLRDLAFEQREDGAVHNCVPNVIPNTLGIESGAAGWGDASVIVPWEIYRAYGDLRLLDEQWSSMKGWVDFAANAAASGRHPSRVARSSQPGEHERYLWDTGFHWGEWLEPGNEGLDLDRLRTADHGIVATAYLYWSATLLARMARLLNRTEDATKYNSLAGSVKGAWQTEFLTDDGLLLEDTQANNSRALAFGLMPEELRGRVADRLAELVVENDYHVGTGFLATPLLLPALADNGHLDTAFRLLLQESGPSWLAMLARGATTVWEMWDAMDEKGRVHGSLNHYSKGAVASFLYTHIAGLRLDPEFPGYRRFLVRPQPGGSLSWAKASHESPFGLIDVSWRIDSGDFVLDLTVPAGTSATIQMPNGELFQASAGSHGYKTRI